MRWLYIFICCRVFRSSSFRRLLYVQRWILVQTWWSLSSMEGVSSVGKSFLIVWRLCSLFTVIQNSNNLLYIRLLTYFYYLILFDLFYRLPFIFTLNILVLIYVWLAANHWKCPNVRSFPFLKFFKEKLAIKKNKKQKKRLAATT